MKCPDCKGKLDVRRNGDWRCGRCHATGVKIGRRAHVLARYISFSGERVHVGDDERGKPIFGVRRGWRLNPWHPNAKNLLTRIRSAAVAR